MQIRKKHSIIVVFSLPQRRTMPQPQPQPVSDVGGSQDTVDTAVTDGGQHMIIENSTILDGKCNGTYSKMPAVRLEATGELLASGWQHTEDEYTYLLQGRKEGEPLWKVFVNEGVVYQTEAEVTDKDGDYPRPVSFKHAQDELYWLDPCDDADYADWGDDCTVSGDGATETFNELFEGKNAKKNNSQDDCEVVIPKDEQQDMQVDSQDDSQDIIGAADAAVGQFVKDTEQAGNTEALQAAQKKIAELEEVVSRRSHRRSHPRYDVFAGTQG